MTNHVLRTIGETIMPNKGEAFEFMDHMDRLIKWYEVNMPDRTKELTVPHIWHGKRIDTILPRVANYNSHEKVWYYGVYRLNFPSA